MTHFKLTKHAFAKSVNFSFLFMFEIHRIMRVSARRNPEECVKRMRESWHV